MLSSYKIEQIRKRQEERDKRSVSVLESFGFAQSVYELPEETKESVTISDKPDPCTNCNGSGKVSSLFGSYECYSCHGTTFDFSDPIAIIRWQSLCNQWAKKELISARKDIARLTNELESALLTDEERKQKKAIDMANSVDRFYSHSKGRLD